MPAPKKAKKSSSTTSSTSKSVSPKKGSSSSVSGASGSSTPDSSPSLTEITCSICFDEVKKEDLTSIDSCKHLFCYSCIEQWSKHENSCPLCKSQFKQLQRVNLGKDGKTTKRKRGKGEKNQMSKKVKPKSQQEDLPRSQFLQLLQQFGPPPPSVLRQLTELARRSNPPPGAPPIELLELVDQMVRGGPRSSSIIFGGLGPSMFMGGDDSDDFDSDYDDEYHTLPRVGGSHSARRTRPSQPSRSFATNATDPNAGTADNALEIDDSDDDVPPLQLRPSTLRDGEVI